MSCKFYYYSPGGGGGPIIPPVDPVTANIYTGLMDTDIPATVDLATLVLSMDAESPHTVHSGLATAGQFFLVLIESDHEFSSITDTVLQQDVTGIFTKTSAVREIGGTDYSSYVVGPLNAGFDESYVVRFG